MTPTEHAILFLLQGSGSLSTKQIADTLGVRAATVRNLTRRLEDQGYLFSQREGNNLHFSTFIDVVLPHLKPKERRRLTDTVSSARRMFSQGHDMKTTITHLTLTHKCSLPLGVCAAKQARGHLAIS